MKPKLILFLILILAFSTSAQVCTESQTQQCGTTDIGACKFGTQNCIDGYWGICEGAVYPSSEVCFDELDNDCDGEVDENCECQSGTKRACGTSDKGICKFGTETCTDNVWSECEGAVLPAVSEICDNNLDDNCNGEIDEECSQKSSCFDNIQNFGETGIDCGGPCPACESCFDKIQNQDETGIDCGGSCGECETCFDRIKNQDETDVDCGGTSCPACPDLEDQDEDQDSLSYAEEITLGTSPSNPDSDYDGIQDNLDALPLCPNNFCDVNYGETPSNCPEDCIEEKSSSPVIIVFMFILILILAVAGIVYFSTHKPKKPKKKTPNFFEKKLNYTFNKDRR